jgi:hypothetical protein
MELNYDLDLAGVIVVNRRRDGSLWVIDGQHRWIAAKRAGEIEMLAQLFTGLTVEQEAAMFRELNSNASPATATQKFKADLVAGDPKAVAIDQVVRRSGTRVKTNQGAAKGIGAVASLIWIYDKSGVEGIALTLKIINNVWPEHQLSGVVVSGKFLKAMYWTLEKHMKDRRDIELKQLVKRLASMEPIMVERKASAYAMSSGGSEWRNVYRAIMEVYNKGRQQKIPEVLP